MSVFVFILEAVSTVFFVCLFFFLLYKLSKDVTEFFDRLI